jgi:hypothetical protein
MLDSLRQRGFDIDARHHAAAILQKDLPEVLADLEVLLYGFTFPISGVVAGGGGESAITQRLRRQLSMELGWTKHNFVITKSIDGSVRESRSHEIDHVKRFDQGIVALEIEWNNKDPFFDRDLENFKRLHAEGAISVGVVLTRGRTLHDSMTDRLVTYAQRAGLTSHQAILEAFPGLTERQRKLIQSQEKTHGPARAWARMFVQDKFGEATTHWTKLMQRIERGVGSPCPLLLIGIPGAAMIDDTEG